MPLSNARIVLYIIGFYILANLPYVPGHIALLSFISMTTKGNLRSTDKYPGSGVILLGRVLSPEFDPTQINIRWTVAGWGDNFAVPLSADQESKGVDDRLLSYLSLPVNVYFDGTIVKAYTPHGTINRTPVRSALNQFSTAHFFDGPQTRSSLRPLYLHRRTANIEIRVVDPTNNRSLPIVELACGPGRLSTGWLLKTEFSEQRVQTGDTSLSSGSYILSLAVREYPQKIVCQVMVGGIILLLSIAGLLFTLWAIFVIVGDGQTISVSDLLALPLGIGATVSAFRVVLPPNSEWEHWIDTTFFYPALIYSLTSAALGFVLSRDTFVRKLRRILGVNNNYEGGGIRGVHQ